LQTRRRRLRRLISNSGPLGASFYVIPYSRTDGPWLYSVEGVKPGEAPIKLSDYAQISNGDYAHAIHGPNGYLFEFEGNSLDTPQMALPNIIDVNSPDEGSTIQFVFYKWPTANGELRIIDAYTGNETTLDPGKANKDTKLTAINVATQEGWYDVSFIDADNTNTYLRRYAGHLDNGKIGKSDPAIGLQYDETMRVYVAVTA